ncbi:MAG: Mur ligase family protein, partial [Candidatus Delongbacteria bacterium]
MRSEYKNIHFIGIDGAGMTPLALHSAKTGYTVTGSDLKDDNFSQLKKAGVSVKKGHSEIPDNTDLVVYSAAVKEDNAELTDAGKKNIECVKRAKFLAKITKDHRSILISGSHGKSTTSVMLADMVNGLFPFYASAIIGAESVSINSNYYAGKGDHVIVEADEYDKSFLQLDPDDLVILNIDNDHLDIYHTTERLKAAFCELAAKLKKDSLLVYNLDDMHSVSVAETAKCRHAGFGIKNRSGYYALDIEFKNMRTSFDLYRSGKYLSKIEYVYTGMHNVYNMLA